MYWEKQPSDEDAPPKFATKLVHVINAQAHGMGKL